MNSIRMTSTIILLQSIKLILVFTIILILLLNNSMKARSTLRKWAGHITGISDPIGKGFFPGDRFYALPFWGGSWHRSGGCRMGEKEPSATTSAWAPGNIASPGQVSSRVSGTRMFTPPATLYCWPACSRTEQHEYTSMRSPTTNIPGKGIFRLAIRNWEEFLWKRR